MTPPLQAPEVLTLGEAAEFLRISERSLWSLAQRGEVPGSRVGRLWRFDRETLRQWLTARAAFPKG